MAHKQHYRVRNWRDYNCGLVPRRSLTLWFRRGGRAVVPPPAETAGEAGNAPTRTWRFSAVRKLMYAALTGASQSWRQLITIELKFRQIEELRPELEAEFRQRTAPEQLPASRSGISRNQKT